MKNTTTVPVQRTIINTKNNSFNLNGKVVDVIEMVGNRVSCKVFVDDLQKFVTADFSKSECVFL
jgi:hypothetical protein